MSVAEEGGDRREIELDESAVPGRARIRAHAATLFNDGLAAARNRRPRDARDLFAACVLWYPNDLEARSAFALACWETGDHEAARGHWESVLEQRPSDGRARRGLALLEAAAGVPVPAGTEAGPADVELRTTDLKLGPADIEPGPATEPVIPAAAKPIATDPPTAPDPPLSAPDQVLQAPAPVLEAAARPTPTDP